MRISRVLSFVTRIMKGCWFFFWGNLLGSLLFDRKFFRGRWFAGRMRGLCSVGWRWVTLDALSCLFTLSNIGAKYPIHHGCTVIHPENVVFHPDDLNNFQMNGSYFQAIGIIQIGKGTYIGPNVGLITANHDLNNLDKHLPPQPIMIGEKCWIGMNSVILPGVTLGKHTIVGAGTVVTKSFPEGDCVIAGNPAKIIKKKNLVLEVNNQ